MEELINGGAALPRSSVCLLYTIEKGDGLLYKAEHGDSVIADKQGGKVCGLEQVKERFSRSQ